MAKIYVHTDSGVRMKITNISVLGRGKWIGEIFTMTDRKGIKRLYNRSELGRYFKILN